jgi:hypothetical protein
MKICHEELTPLNGCSINQSPLSKRQVVIHKLQLWKNVNLKKFCAVHWRSLKGPQFFKYQTIKVSYIPIHWYHFCSSFNLIALSLPLPDIASLSPWDVISTRRLIVLYHLNLEKLYIRTKPYTIFVKLPPLPLYSHSPSPSPSVTPLRSPDLSCLIPSNSSTSPVQLSLPFLPVPFPLVIPRPLTRAMHICWL